MKILIILLCFLLCLTNVVVAGELAVTVPSSTTYRLNKMNDGSIHFYKDFRLNNEFYKTKILRTFKDKNGKPMFCLIELIKFQEVYCVRYSDLILLEEP